MKKTSTDHHWNERAVRETDDTKVNIADTVQRELETNFVLSCLPSKGKVLEVGCGNGHLTSLLRERVEYVDSFDFSENMIQRARRNVGERNNRFSHASVLAREAAPQSEYRAIVCIRVLINLANLNEQLQAVKNMATWLEPGGVLILVEGFRDGFDSLNELRQRIGMSEVTPAKINFYSSLQDIMPTLNEGFAITSQWHSGMFDFLTRIVYPALIGVDGARGPSDFHEKIKPIADSFNPQVFEPFARVRGFCFVKR